MPRASASGPMAWFRKLMLAGAAAIAVVLVLLGLVTALLLASLAAA